MWLYSEYIENISWTSYVPRKSLNGDFEIPPDLTLDLVQLGQNVTKSFFPDSTRIYYNQVTALH